MSTLNQGVEGNKRLLPMGRDVYTDNVYTLEFLRGTIGPYNFSKVYLRTHSKTTTDIQRMVGATDYEWQIAHSVIIKTDPLVSIRDIKEKCAELRKSIMLGRTSIPSPNVNPGAQCLELDIVCTHVRDMKTKYFSVATLTTQDMDEVMLWHNILDDMSGRSFDRFLKRNSILR